MRNLWICIVRKRGIIFEVATQSNREVRQEFTIGKGEMKRRPTENGAEIIVTLLILYTGLGISAYFLFTQGSWGLSLLSVLIVAIVFLPLSWAVNLLWEYIGLPTSRRCDVSRLKIYRQFEPIKLNRENFGQMRKLAGKLYDYDDSSGWQVGRKIYTHTAGFKNRQFHITGSDHSEGYSGPRSHDCGYLVVTRDAIYGSRLSCGLECLIDEISESVFLDPRYSLATHDKESTRSR